MGYGRFVEPWWPCVTRVEVRSAKLSGATRPVRIVQISDLHSEARPRLEEQIPELISELAPDVVIFTGDAVGSGGLPVFRRLMTRLADAVPVFAVLGNWDVGYSLGQELYGGTGVHVLESEAEAITIAGATIRILGVTAGEASNAAALVADATATGDFTVFAYHYPDLVEDLRDPGPDLYLAGHTHGGQVALPFYGALVTLSKFDKRYEAGLYTVGSTTLYVNSGIGMVGGSAPRVRFFARPEVTLITLVPKP